MPGVQFYSEPIKIIENTKQAQDEYGHAYGSGQYKITRGDIGALLDGKCLALSIGDEYVAFVYMNPEEVIKENVSE